MIPQKYLEGCFMLRSIDSEDKTSTEVNLSKDQESGSSTSCLSIIKACGCLLFSCCPTISSRPESSQLNESYNAVYEEGRLGVYSRFHP